MRRTVITAEARRLERLVADLLDLARLDARQFSLAPRPIDAADTVRTAVDAFRPAATDLGITLQVDGPDDRSRPTPTPTGWRRSSPTSWRTR